MKYDFIAVDFETATTKSDSACSIGIAAVKDLVIVDEFYSLIQPPNNTYYAPNIRIHGITPEMTETEKTFDEIWKTISCYFMEADYVFAHNVGFDMMVLRALQDRYKLDIQDFEYIDSMAFSSKKRTTEKRSLEACCEFFGIQLLEHHNSLCDADACAKIVIESVNRSRYKSFQSYLRSYSSIHIHNYYKDNEQKKTSTSAKPFYRHEKVIYTEIEKEDGSNTIAEVEGKLFVVTGELTCMSRKEICQTIVNAGGLVKSSVSKKTDYLIVGQQDPSIVGEKGISLKEIKANEIIEAGGNISILREDDFKLLFHLERCTVH